MSKNAGQTPANIEGTSIPDGSAADDQRALKDLVRAASQTGPIGPNATKLVVSTPRGGPDDPRQNHDSSPETGDPTS